MSSILISTNLNLEDLSMTRLNILLTISWTSHTKSYKVIKTRKQQKKKKKKANKNLVPSELWTSDIFSLHFPSFYPFSKLLATYGSLLQLSRFVAPRNPLLMERGIRRDTYLISATILQRSHDSWSSQLVRFVWRDICNFCCAPWTLYL